MIVFNIRHANFKKKAKAIVKELNDTVQNCISLLQEADWESGEWAGKSIVDGRTDNISDCRGVWPQKLTRNLKFQEFGRYWSAAQFADIYIYM